MALECLQEYLKKKLQKFFQEYIPRLFQSLFFGGSFDDFPRVPMKISTEFFLGVSSIFFSILEKVLLKFLVGNFFLTLLREFIKDFFAWVCQSISLLLLLQSFNCSGIVSGVPSKSSPGVHSSGSVGIVFRSQSENILELSTKSLFENSLEVALDLCLVVVSKTYPWEPFKLLMEYLREFH